MATDHPTGPTHAPSTPTAADPPATDAPAVDTETLPDQDVAARCPYCDRPFTTVQARNLHVGQRHPRRCTEAERDAYEEADEQEREDLFLYHIKAVVAIGLTWGAFVVLYMVALGSGIF